MRALGLMLVFAALCAPPALAAHNACASIPANGAILDGDSQFRRAADPFDRTEGHTVEIANRARGDAIVKLRDAATGRLVVSFLVARGSVARIAGLGDGGYVLQFAAGDRLASDCKSFVHARGISQLRTAERLVTHSAGYTMETSHLRFVLYGGGNGALQPVPIGLAAFNAP